MEKLMKFIIFVLIATVSVLAQDFIPHIDQFQPSVVDRMRDNKVKRMEVESHLTDANFKPAFDKANYVYSYDYNEMGFLLLADYYNLTEDIRIETSYAYTDNGTLESVVQIETANAASGNPFVTTTTLWATIDGGKIEYMTKYVSTGQDVNVNSSVTNKYIFRYDNNQLLTSILDSVLEQGSGANTLYEFNMRGEVVLKSSDNFSTNYYYDDKGNIIQEIMVINGSSYITSNKYDAEGNLVATTVDSDAYSFDWEVQNLKNGLVENSYSVFSAKSDQQKTYEWNSYIYTYR